MPTILAPSYRLILGFFWLIDLHCDTFYKTYLIVLEPPLFLFSFSSLSSFYIGKTCSEELLSVLILIVISCSEMKSSPISSGYLKG